MPPPPRKRRTKAEIERAKKKASSARKHHLKTKHRMTQEEYDDLKTFQEGLCYICRRGKGIRRNLAIDHWHDKEGHGLTPHPDKESCVLCWRGLLCALCNDMLAHARDDVMVFARAIDYLQKPPAQRWLGAVREAMEAYGTLEHTENRTLE